jgi:hypothetical protein
MAGVDDIVKVAGIVAIAPTVAALGAVWLGWINRIKLRDVGERVDGRLTELLELTRKASLAQGIKEEKERAPKAVEKTFSRRK